MTMKTTIQSLRAVVMDHVPDLLLVGGAAAVSVGVGCIYLAAGIIVGGLFSMWAGWLLSRRGGQ